MRHKSSFIIIFIGFLSVLSSILSNLTPRINLSSTFVIAFQYAWILFLSFTVILIIIEFLQYRRATMVKQIDIQRQWLKEKVRFIWITGLLEQSLHGSVFIMPEVRMHRDAILSTRRSTSQQTNQNLPSKMYITQIYDYTFGQFLILGKPGAGKTTLLLELARDMLDRASRDINHPIPVVFNLSHWTKKWLTIDTWLVEELNNEYKIPKYLGNHLVNANVVLPLLDNLDQVPQQNRQTCIDAINHYTDYSFNKKPIVVCCRSNEYRIKSNRLLLHGAITVQPFTPQQIDDYLASADEPVTDLHTVIRNDPELQELIATPQILSMLTNAYREKPDSNSSLTISSMTRQQQISAAYVKSMLLQHIAKPYSLNQTILWLSLLAKRLVKADRTLFCIEDMDSTWLSRRPLRFLYNLITLLLVCLICGLIGSLIAGSFGALLGILEGLLLFRRITKMQIPQMQIAPMKIFFQLKKDIWRNLSFSLVGGLIIGIASGIIALLLFWQIGGLIVGLVGGLILGSLSGLVGGFVGGIVVLQGTAFSGEMLQETASIIPDQSLWLYAFNSVLVGIFGGLLLTLLIILILSIILALLAAVIGGLYGLFTEGLVGLLKDSGTGFAATFPFLLAGLGGGIKFIWGMSGLYLWLTNGGNRCIRILILRLFLYSTKRTPWNYSRFLDYATGCHLLHKVGTGYIFAYRPLLDYFASLDEVIVKP